MRTIIKAEEINLSNWAGIKITTTEGRIEFLIDNNQNCCEGFGYKITFGNLSDLIGHIPRYFEMEEESEKFKDDRFVRKLNIKFFIQTVDDHKAELKLQLSFYCEHNGYYSHNVLVFDEDNPDRVKVISL
ncbi:MAG TPA: hypothetical protein ENH85_06195 [Candidatus Scalindua sp.]|nr:hypothetical protein [Candidatus Scalindua sp.]